MYPATPNTAASDEIGVIVTSVTFGTLLMVVRSFYLFTCTTNCWIKQSDAGTAATVGAGSMFWPANVPLFLAGKYGAKLSVIRDTADGKASLTPCEL